MNMEWNFDIGQAPKGHWREVRRNVGNSVHMSREHVPDLIIAAGNGGVVTVSKWIEKEGRWNMFTKDVPPMAWIPWPSHPSEARK